MYANNAPLAQKAPFILDPIKTRIISPGSHNRDQRGLCMKKKFNPHLAGPEPMTSYCLAYSFLIAPPT